MLRLFVEEERNERAFEAADALPRRGRRDPGRARAAARRSTRSRSRSSSSSSGSPATSRTSRAVSSAAESTGSSATSPRAGGAVCSPCAPDETVFLAPEGFRGAAGAHLEPALGRARPRARGARAARRAGRRRRVVRVPRRLPPPHARRMKRDLGDGYELDDDPARIDRDAVHAYLGGVSYWAKGRPREVQDALDRRARSASSVSTRDGRADRLLADALGRARAVVPRGRLRPRRAPRARARRRARALLRRGRAARENEVVPAHASTRTTCTASSASRSRASECSSAAASEPTPRRRCSPHVTRAVFVVLVALLGLGGTMASSAAPPTAGCDSIIDPDYASARAWRPERVVLGVVDVPKAFIPQAATASGVTRWPYWMQVGPRRSCQQPCRSRLGAGGLEATGRDRLGRRTRRSRRMRIASCLASSTLPGGWNPYAGGFVLRSPTACVPLMFRVGDRTATVRFGIGKRCG